MSCGELTIPLWRGGLATTLELSQLLLTGRIQPGRRMSNPRIGFIGLGNVGSQLAGNLLRHGIDLTVRDVDAERVAALVARGARAADSPRELAAGVERVLPVLAILGQRLLHTGPVGSASMLKVLTNYLCTVHLAALAEALTVAKVSGLDLNTTYEGIRISSGNSFVHETESQVILNGSRDINFTMDLVIKDVGLFDELARAHGVPLELSPLVLGVFRDGARRYGERELSPNIIRRLEEACGVRVLGEGFPPQIVDTEPKVPGYEVVPRRRPAP